MTSGRPIIASDVPSIREVLNEDEAFWYSPDDPISLAEAVQRVLSNQNARKITNRLKKKVREYDWSKRAEKILKIL